MTDAASGRLSLSELERLIRSGEIDTVMTVFPDLYGRLVGKRITGHFFLEETAADGMHCCDYLLACDMEMDPVAGYEFASWQRGYGDILARPDLATLRRAGWLERTAVVFCDLFDEHDHQPVAVAPRTILQRQRERAAAMGFVAKAGSELEFFLLRESYEEADGKYFAGLTPFGRYVEDYHILQGAREEPIVGAIRRAMDASAVPVEFSKGEWGPGQHEINLRYGEVLEMADRHALYKEAAKQIAAAHGHALTFMAKFDEALAGNSFHLHMSLWSKDDDRPVFAGDSPLPGSDVAASDAFRWYLGGLLTHARECMLLFAPNVNSYKRYVAGSFAPTRIAWSYDNRTVGFRLVGSGSSLRAECRVPGGDANPYLVMAIALAAGLDGIERRVEPPAQFRGDAYQAGELPCVPLSLEEALREFRSSAWVRSVLGDAVVDHYAHFAEIELQKFARVVTTWERRRFLERG
ncbi:MAG TPA: glutamine synthetase family protein [Candidatus Limnocylindrales bacterium]|nr:glutamine synthetase family protein [Candidatus Limnocylindrales bacterium]